MSQPELEFEFDPPEFLSDKARSLQASKKPNILKHVTAAGLLIAATVGIVSLFYGHVTSDINMQALAEKNNPLATEGNNTAIADAKVLLTIRRKNKELNRKSGVTRNQPVSV